MKAFLLYQDQDFDLRQSLPPQAEALIQDLDLSPFSLRWRAATRSCLRWPAKRSSPV